MNVYKNYLYTVLAGVFILLSMTAQANEQLAMESACVACHAANYKRVGPSYHDIAARYEGADEKIVEQIVARVKGGSRYMWGTLSMPAMPLVTNEDAHSLVRWILSQQ